MLVLMFDGCSLLSKKGRQVILITVTKSNEDVDKAVKVGGSAVITSLEVHRSLFKA